MAKTVKANIFLRVRVNKYIKNIPNMIKQETRISLHSRISWNMFSYLENELYMCELSNIYIYIYIYIYIGHFKDKPYI